MDDFNRRARSEISLTFLDFDIIQKLDLMGFNGRSSDLRVTHRDLISPAKIGI